MLQRARRFLDPNPQPGTGAPPAAPAPAPAPAPRRRVVLPGRAEHGYQALLQQYGGPDNLDAVTAAGRFLYDENHATRAKLKERSEALEAFKTRNPDGSVVLHGQDLADYNTWKALGKPADVKAQVDELKTLKAKVAEDTKKANIARAAKALGYNSAVLTDRLAQTGLDLDVTEETGSDNVKRDIAKVRPTANASASWETLGAVAERDWKEHLPGLKTTNGTGTPGVIELPNNGATGSGGAGTAVASFIKQNAEAAEKAKARNPLAAKGK